MATTGVAVVTGAGSGLGRVVARALLDAGWRVALAGRRGRALAETRAGPAAEHALAQPTDVTEPGSVAGLFGAVHRTLGPGGPAGQQRGRVRPGGRGGRARGGRLAAVVDTNLTGAFLCARQAVRDDAGAGPRGGRIINNGSISAHTPRPGSVAYTATKHALTGLTKSLSLDGRRYGIACGQIDIGNAATEMTERMAAGRCRPTAAWRPSRPSTPGTSPMRCCTWRGCRWTPTCSS